MYPRFVIELIHCISRILNHPSKQNHEQWMETSKLENNISLRRDINKNCKLIILTYIAFKLMESLIKKLIITHMGYENLLSYHQRSFPLRNNYCHILISTSKQ